MRNAADDLGCPLVILTTQHGLVRAEDIIAPYDMHIDEYTAAINQKWSETVPRLLPSGQYDLVMLYAGGCPREKYLALLLPILNSIPMPLITFGTANMADSDHIRDVATMLMNGTTLDAVRDILNFPKKLDYYLGVSG